MMTREEIVGNVTQEVKEKMYKCPICDKDIFVPYKSSYTYRVKNKRGKIRYTCSYKCFNEIKKIIGKG